MAFAPKSLLRNGSRVISNGLAASLVNSQLHLTRCLSISTVLSQGGVFSRNRSGSDPIQQLFLEKVREYEQKKKASGGRLVDASPEQQKALEEEMQRLLRQFGGKNEDEMHQYPQLSFKETEFDQISVQVEPEKQPVDPELIRKELLAMKRTEEDLEDTRVRDASI